MKQVIFFFLIFNFTTLKAQQTFTSSQFQFEMQEPIDWIAADNAALRNNLEKFKVDNPGLKKLISDNNGSLLLTSYYKYDPGTRAGVIPTIQVNVRNKGKSTFAQFKSAMIQSSNSFKTIFPDFEFIEQPREITISGIKSVCFIGKFTMKSQDGTELKVRSRTYAIPYKDYFFQINFTDSQIGEDCTKEFNDLLTTIKVGN